MSRAARTPLAARLRWPGREPLPVEPGPTRAVIARTFLYLYGAGGTLALGTLLLPHSGARSELGIALPGLAAYAVALTMLLAFERLPLWSFHLLPPLGTGLATVVVWSGGPWLMTAYAGFYFWVVLSSFYLFPARFAWLNVLLVGVAFAFALAAEPGRAQRAVTWAMMMGALAVGGAMIGLLRSRLEALLGELAAALARSRHSEHALAEAQRVAAIGSWELDLAERTLSYSREFRRIFSLREDATRQLDLVLEQVDPRDRRDFVATFERAIEGGGIVDTDVRVQLPDDSSRTIHVRGQVELADGRAVRILGTAQDVTWQRAQKEELERTLRRLAATTEIALALGRDTQPAQLLRQIAERTHALLGAEGVAIYIPEAESMRRVATVGDTRELPSFPADVVGHGDVRRSGATIIAPLALRGDVHGLLLAVCEPGSDGFTREDEEMLSAFATSAATAVAAAKSVEQEALRRSIEGGERERRRWARELHDETLQGLAVLRIRLEMALDEGGAVLDRAARAALEQIDADTENLRRIIADLRPALLEEFGLAPALEALGERVAAGCDMEIATAVDLGDDPDLRLPPELEQTIYRLAQEALTNACKHSGARSVSVSVASRRSELHVEVADDGHGFDVSAPVTGFGLAGIRERVRLAAGRLTVRSGSHGTTVEAVLPLPEGAALAPERPAAAEAS